LHYEIHYETRFARTLPRSRFTRWQAAQQPNPNPPPPTYITDAKSAPLKAKRLQFPRTAFKFIGGTFPPAAIVDSPARRCWVVGRIATQNQVCAALENDRSDVELFLNCRRVRNVADELGPEALVVQFSAAPEPLSAL